MQREPGRLATPPARDEDDNTAWLVTFSDLVLLLLAFGVISVVSNHRAPAVDHEPVRVAVVDVAPRDESAAPDALDRFEPGPSAAAVSEPELEPASPEPVADAPATEEVVAVAAPSAERRLAETAAELSALVTAEGLPPGTTVAVEGSAVVLALGETIGFPSGSADLRPEASPIIDAVRALAKAEPDLRIEVAGHTDDVAIRSAEYPSNLELSLARAARVAREVVSGDATLAVRTVAAGFGEYRPVADNHDPNGRARNRRVEVRLIPASYSIR